MSPDTIALIIIYLVCQAALALGAFWDSIRLLGERLVRKKVNALPKCEPCNLSHRSSLTSSAAPPVTSDFAEACCNLRAVHEQCDQEWLKYSGYQQKRWQRTLTNLAGALK